MQSSPDNLFVHPAPTSFVDECCATLARLIVYVGTLALFGILAVYAWDRFRLDQASEPAVATGFVQASHSRPAFAVSSFDLPEKSEVYEIFRHAAGGRKDVLHWGPPGERAVAELEIYRPGGEHYSPESSEPTVAAGMAPSEMRVEPAGMIDSKFGPFALFRVRGSRDDAKSCLGFFKRFGDPALQIAGWSCQAASLAARRAAIGCMLNRLTLLVSGNEPKIAELFARAELKRDGCAATPAASADWVTTADSPRLRGAL